MKSIAESYHTRFFLSIMLLAVALATGCGGASQIGRRTADMPAGYADTLYAQLKDEFGAGQFNAAEKTARQLLSN